MFFEWPSSNLNPGTAAAKSLCKQQENARTVAHNLYHTPSLVKGLAAIASDGPSNLAFGDMHLCGDTLASTLVHSGLADMPLGAH